MFGCSFEWVNLTALKRVCRWLIKAPLCCFAQGFSAVFFSRSRGKWKRKEGGVEGKAVAVETVPAGRAGLEAEAMKVGAVGREIEAVTVGTGAVPGDM